MAEKFEQGHTLESSKFPDELAQTLREYFRDDRLDQDSNNRHMKVRLGSKTLYRLFGLSMNHDQLPVEIDLSLEPVATGTKLHVDLRSNQGFYMAQIAAVEPAYDRRFAELVSDLETVI